MSGELYDIFSRFSDGVVGLFNMGQSEDHA